MNTLFIFDSKNTFKLGIKLLKYLDHLDFLEDHRSKNISDLNHSVDSFVGKINISNKHELSKILTNKEYRNVVIHTENEELNVVCGYIISKISSDINISIINSSFFYNQLPYIEQCSVISSWSLVSEAIKKELKFLRKEYCRQSAGSTCIVKTNKKDAELVDNELESFTYKNLNKDKHQKYIEIATNDVKFTDFASFFKKNRHNKVFKIGIFCSSNYVDFIKEIDFFDNPVCFLIDDHETDEPYCESIKNVKISDLKDGDIDVVLCVHENEKDNILKSLYFSEKLNLEVISICSFIGQNFNDLTLIESEKLIINKILKNIYAEFFHDILFLDNDRVLIALNKDKNDLFKHFDKKKIEEVLDVRIVSAEKKNDFFLHDFSTYKWENGDIVTFLLKTNKINDFMKNYENA